MKVKFTKYDIETDYVGKEKFNALGQSSVPVTKIGETVIAGYNPGSILSAIRK